MKRIVDFTAIVITLIFAGGLNALADEVLKQRFLKEYPGESKLLANRLARVNGKMFSETSDKKQKIEYDFKVDHGKEKVHFVKTGVSRGVSIRLESVECYGNGQFFTLERHEVDEPFGLKGIGTSEREILFYENYSGRLLTVSLGARPILLYKLMETKTFELLDVSLADPSSGQIWVTFLFGPVPPKSKCRVLLDPANHWSVLKQEMFDKESGKVSMSMTVEYGDPLEGFRMPKVVRLMRAERNEYPVVYSDWKFIGTPESEFNLTHYKLPDIFAKRVQKRWIPFYFGIGLILSLCIVIIFYYRFSRVAKSRNNSNQFTRQA